MSSDDPAPPLPHPPARGRAASTPATILVVEDEAIVALDLRTQLEDLGYEVIGIADTAAGAVDLARCHRPDLTLMDVVLQGEGDGVDAAAAMQALGGLPVMFLTSFSDNDTVRRAAETAPYGYLTKPFQTRELRAGIEVALAKSRLERQLRDAERWYASTLRCVQDGIVVTDTQGRIRFLNRAAELLIGRTFDDVQGTHVDAVIVFAERRDGAGSDGAAPPPPAHSALTGALQHGRVVGIRHARPLRRAGGGTVPVDEWAGPVQGDAGERIGGVLVLRDVTERLERDAAVQSSEARFRTAFEHAPLGMALVALDGRFLQVNTALCRLLDTDAAALGARTQASVTHADDLATEAGQLASLARPGAEVVQFEKRYLRADGTEVWTLVSASLLTEPDGPSCHLYQVHDLTAQHQAAQQRADVASERMRREAGEQASRAKGEFLARISHEMRTPLNAVIGFAQLLRMQAPAKDVAPAAYADHILSAGHHLLALVDDVLQLQTDDPVSGALEAAVLPLARVVDDALTMVQQLAAEHGVAVLRTIDPGLGVRADERRLRQVVMNLVSNAVKYNHVGGSVVCSAQSTPGHVRLEVRDTGIGMTPEQLARLFEPFERLGRESSAVPGVGLGLVITRKLIEQMGGRLAITAAPAGGTVATVELPAPGDPA